MPAPVPSLSSSGWVTSPAEKADLLFSYYLTSEDSQSLLYAGNIVSLPAQVQSAGHDALELRSRIRNDLQNYLSPYFEQVIVEVETEENPNDSGRLEIRVECTVVDNATTYSLGRLISTVNSKITNIINLNNTGNRS